MKVNIIFYSMYGHIHKMAEAIAEGAREVEGVEIGIYQVPETLSDEVLVKMGAIETKKTLAHIPIATHENLTEADGIIFGCPTRFGNMPAQMRAFLDATGGLWAKNALVGKVGSVFTSSNTQHGGQETTITSFWNTLIHHGMIIAGCPYSAKGISYTDDISGGGPYGASTIGGSDGSRQPSENELEVACFQGKYVAEIASALVKGRG